MTVTDSARVAFLLRNTPVREIIAALERDGFGLRRSTRRDPASTGIPMAAERSDTTTGEGIRW